MKTSHAITAVCFLIIGVGMGAIFTNDRINNLVDLADKIQSDLTTTTTAAETAESEMDRFMTELNKLNAVIEQQNQFMLQLPGQILDQVREDSVFDEWEQRIEEAESKLEESSAEHLAETERLRQVIQKGNEALADAFNQPGAFEALGNRIHGNWSAIFGE